MVNEHFLTLLTKKTLFIYYRKLLSSQWKHKWHSPPIQKNAYYSPTNVSD